MSSDEDSEDFCCTARQCHLCTSDSPPSSPPPPPPPPPSSPVTPRKELPAWMTNPIYRPNSPEQDRSLALQEPHSPVHHESAISSTRPRDGSSISMSQVPNYMSHGQILPASGLSTVVFPPSPTSSAPDFSHTFPFSGKNAEGSTKQEADEDAHTDAEEEEEGPRFPYEMPTPKPTLCYRYKIQAGARSKSNSEPAENRVLGFKSYAHFKKAASARGDEPEDEVDAESGGVLIRSPSKSSLKEKVIGVEKFPGFDYRISESLLEQEHTFGTIPVRKRSREVMEYKHVLIRSAVSDKSGELVDEDADGEA